MDQAVLGEKAQGSVNAALEDQAAKSDLNNSLRTSSSQTLRTKPSTSSSTPSTTATTTTSNNSSNKISKEELIAGKIKMADRNDSLVMLLTILAMIPVILGALIKMGVSWKGFLGGGVALFVSLTMRILYLKHGYNLEVLRRLRNLRRQPDGAATTLSSSSNLLDGLPAAYFLYVLGSGGHTAEMFELIRITSAPAPNVHRRYVYTTGDNNSLDTVMAHEQRVAEKFGRNGGTWDAFQVKRARKVHQPFYTAWFTALQSIVSIYEALTTVPEQRRRTARERELFKFPHCITTNGPGNGVITAFVARLLKIFFFAPNNCMKVIFFETWAHVSTLSLTGKIFHWARYLGGAVDMFLVQHAPLTAKYGYQQYDFITPTGRRPETDDDVKA